MELPQNCANCEHFDGDDYCTLPESECLIPGYIPDPSMVVCVKHEPKQDDDAAEPEAPAR